jgi:hypothetical protein
MSQETSGDPLAIDNFTPSRKEGWAAFVHAPPRSQPERLTRRQIRALSNDAVAEYNERRSTWHANLGPLNTPPLASTTRGFVGYRRQQRPRRHQSERFNRRRR